MIKHNIQTLAVHAGENQGKNSEPAGGRHRIPPRIDRPRECVFERRHPGNEEARDSLEVR